MDLVGRWPCTSEDSNDTVAMSPYYTIIKARERRACDTPSHEVQSIETLNLCFRPGVTAQGKKSAEIRLMTAHIPWIRCNPPGRTLLGSTSEVDPLGAKKLELGWRRSSSIRLRSGVPVIVVFTAELTLKNCELRSSPPDRLRDIQTHCNTHLRTWR